MDFESAMALVRTGKNMKRVIGDDGYELVITTNHTEGHLRSVGESGLTSVWRPDRESIEATNWEAA